MSVMSDLNRIHGLRTDIIVSDIFINDGDRNFIWVYCAPVGEKPCGVGVKGDISFNELRDLITFKHENQNFMKYSEAIRIFVDNHLNKYIGTTFSGGYTLTQTDYAMLKLVCP